MATIRATLHLADENVFSDGSAAVATDDLTSCQSKSVERGGCGDTGGGGSDTAVLAIETVAAAIGHGAVAHEDTLAASRTHGTASGGVTEEMVAVMTAEANRLSEESVPAMGEEQLSSPHPPAGAALVGRESQKTIHGEQQLAQIQEQVALSNTEFRMALDTNEAIIEHKKLAMRAIASEVQDLNQLFIELGHYVVAQGAEVENIVTLAEEAAVEVAAARRELEIADRDQQKGCLIS